MWSFEALARGRVAIISLRGASASIERQRGRARRSINARAARKFDSDCARPQAGLAPRSRRNRAKWTLHARCRPLVNVANSLTSPQIPREAAHKRTHSWPDDEEEHRQQHSDGHAADVDAVLPVAPPARESNVTRRPRARRDVVPVSASVRWHGISGRVPALISRR